MSEYIVYHTFRGRGRYRFLVETYEDILHVTNWSDHIEKAIRLSRDEALNLVVEVQRKSLSPSGRQVTAESLTKFIARRMREGDV